MIIDRAIVGPLGNNCYLIADENSKLAAMVDAGYGFDDLYEMVCERGYRLAYLFLTHGHFDHTASAGKLREATGAKIVVHQADAEALYDDEKSLFAHFYTIPGMRIKADITVLDGDHISMGDLDFSFIHTPGHSPGGMCIRCQDALFTGDTLLKGTIGNIDLPFADMGALSDSIEKKLLPIKENLTLYPGHGEITTLDAEKAHNPFIAVILRDGEKG